MKLPWLVDQDKRLKVSTSSRNRPVNLLQIPKVLNQTLRANIRFKTSKHRKNIEHCFS